MHSVKVFKIWMWLCNSIVTSIHFIFKMWAIFDILYIDLVMYIDKYMYQKHKITHILERIVCFNSVILNSTFTKFCFFYISI
jgi:hypothetical protein